MGVKAALGAVAGTLLLAACGARGGAASPQEAFDAARAAAGRKDWATFISMYDSAGARFQAHTALVFCEMAAGPDVGARAGLEGIAARHGVDPTKLKGDPRPSREAALRNIEEAFRNVRDFPALFVETMGFLRDRAPAAPFEPIGTGLAGVKVEGDRASGKAARRAGAAEEVEFRREGGKWFISFRP